MSMRWYAVTAVFLWACGGAGSGAAPGIDAAGPGYDGWAGAPVDAGPDGAGGDSGAAEDAGAGPGDGRADSTGSVDVPPVDGGASDAAPGDGGGLTDATPEDAGEEGDAEPVDAVQTDGGAPEDSSGDSTGGDTTHDTTPPCVASPETCNGADDDCDGGVDEDLTEACAAACGQGTRTCTGGVWGECAGAAPVGCTDYATCETTPQCAPCPAAPPETCNGADDDCDGAVDEGLASCGPCGTPWDTTVSAPYAIEGTWMYARSSACEWQKALEAFHRIGGTTVWQFGPSLEPRTDAQIKADPVFSTCIDGGVHCLDKAWSDLGGKVSRWLVYDFNEDYGDAILTCAGLDRKIVVGDRTFWRIVLPHSAGQAPCDVGAGVDVLLTTFKAPESSEHLLSGADALGMKVILGMPSMPPKPGQPWTVDTTLRPAYLDWARRVLTDYAARHADHPSFAGVYQSFEVQLQASGNNVIFDTYGMVGALVHAALPGKVYALSPYWDVNTTQGKLTVASVKEGFKRLAREGADIIAPQDGRGTGKGALFWPYEKDSNIADIDPLLAQFPNVGATTFGARFNASTRELFDAARAATDELLAQEGIDVELWANIEAFENIPGAPCGYPFALRRTEKQRLDRALTFGGSQPSHIVSFMWDAYFTCLDGGYGTSLADDITADHGRPIASSAFLWQGGIVVRGFGVATPGTTFALTWYDDQWKVHSTTVEQGWTNPSWGAQNGRSPRLQEAWIPFAEPLAPSFYVHIRPSSPAGAQAHHAYSLAY